jgi:hypothetical protein
MPCSLADISAMYQPCLTACQVRPIENGAGQRFPKKKTIGGNCLKHDAREARDRRNFGRRVYSCAAVITFDTLAVRFRKLNSIMQQNK